MNYSPSFSFRTRSLVANSFVDPIIHRESTTCFFSSPQTIQSTIEVPAVTVNAHCYCYGRSSNQSQHTMLDILLLNAIDNDVGIGTENYNEIDKRVK